jgi:hypothetical protein
VFGFKNVIMPLMWSTLGIQLRGLSYFKESLDWMYLYLTYVKVFLYFVIGIQERIYLLRRNLLWLNTYTNTLHQSLDKIPGQIQFLYSQRS